MMTGIIATLLCALGLNGCYNQDLPKFSEMERRVIEGSARDNVLTTEAARIMIRAWKSNAATLTYLIVVPDQNELVPLIDTHRVGTTRPGSLHETVPENVPPLRIDLPRPSLSEPFEEWIIPIIMTQQDKSFSHGMIFFTNFRRTSWVPTPARMVIRGIPGVDKISWEVSVWRAIRNDRRWAAFLQEGGGPPLAF
jgi:hypothetical protein